MNRLFCLLFLLIRPLQSGADEQLSLDIDRDGIADELVTTNTGDREFLHLQLKLSASGKTLSFEKLIPLPWQERGSLNPDDGSACGSVLANDFAMRGGLLFWSQRTGDYDACASESGTTLGLRVVKGTLLLEEYSSYGRHRSMGDPSPYGRRKLDFRRGVVEVMEGESHTGIEGHGKSRLPGGCTAPVLRDGAPFLPDCAQRAMRRAESAARARFCGKWKGSDCP